MPLYAVSIALSAMLLFLVQPIIARQILTWFGGSAGVWTTCMVFFQTALLAGYGYAHWLSRKLSSRRQWTLHTALLLLSLAFLPILVSEQFRPAGSQDESSAILLLLVATIGLPYFLLASTGPLLQSWLVRQWPHRAVYRLFALSNAASLAGLIAYPFLIEPHFGVRAQAFAWSAIYAAFVLVCAGAAWRMARTATSAALLGPVGNTVEITHRDSEHQQPSADGRPHNGPGAPGGPWVWAGLSALGVVIVLGATAHITQNIASVPFLWLAPLVLYLLSFVLAFEGRSGRGWYSPTWGIPAALAAAMLMALGLSVSDGLLDITLSLPLYCAGVLVACMFCHGELALRRPKTADLTRFYLMVSLGGALGGIFSGLIAPRLFQGVYEFPLALLGIGVAAVLAAWHQPMFGPHRPWVCALAVTATLATGFWNFLFVELLQDHTMLMTRNFYGTLRVQQRGKGTMQRRILSHGVVVHGLQFLYGANRLEPLTYYGRDSGIGLAIKSAQREREGIRLGVIGLGIGTLSAYGRAGDTIRFYEINPDVVAIARREFSYLSSTPAKVQIALGDARLCLQREIDGGAVPRFDVLAVDAFSGDSIPVHLLTRQAIELYANSLAGGGILALHITNRFVDLKPVLANVAAELGLHATLVAERAKNGFAITEWVLISAHPDAFDQAPFAGRTEPLVRDPRLGVWTDDSNDLLSAVRGTPLDALHQLLGD